MFLSQGFEACFCRRVLFKVTLHPSFSSTHSLVIYQGGGCIGERVVLVNVYLFLFCLVWSNLVGYAGAAEGVPRSLVKIDATKPEVAE